MRTTICFGPGVKFPTSSSRNTSGPPNSCTGIAFIFPPFGFTLPSTTIRPDNEEQVCVRPRSILSQLHALNSPADFSDCCGLGQGLNPNGCLRPKPHASRPPTGLVRLEPGPPLRWPAGGCKL